MIKEIINDFEKLSSSELKKILKSLKLYKDLSTKLWNRGKNLFSSLSSWKSVYKVKYFEGLSEDEALKQALVAYKEIFGDSPKSENIILEKSNSLGWGIKIYKDDNMSDLSFNRIENILI
jgi:hypothetical protein